MHLTSCHSYLPIYKTLALSVVPLLLYSATTSPCGVVRRVSLVPNYIVPSHILSKVSFIYFLPEVVK